MYNIAMTLVWVNCIVIILMSKGDPAQISHQFSFAFQRAKDKFVKKHQGFIYIDVYISEYLMPQSFWYHFWYF